MNMRFFDIFREFLEGPPEPENDSYLKFMNFTPQVLQSYGFSEKEIARTIKDAKRRARREKT